MVDALRSSIMRSVPRKMTKPEMIVRRALHAVGYRFQTNMCSLPGSPDIVFTARRKAIFVHGCFWHRHEHCRYSTTPKENRAFWVSKFSSNIDRDQRNVCDLERLGWQVEIVWQCETRDKESLINRLVEFVGPTSVSRKRNLHSFKTSPAKVTTFGDVS